MLQRIIIHFSLILLFAFTQLGIATHSISHLTDNHNHQQQEQNSVESQCGQCLSLSHAANANLAQIFDFQIALSDQILIANTPASDTSSTSSLYSARAPPHPSQA